MNIDLVKIAKQHFEADMLLKGTYGFDEAEPHRGCSVGCLAHSMGYKGTGNIHAFVAEKAGYPEWLVRLQDTIFEGLPNGPSGENSKWHVQLAEAIAALPEDHDWQAAYHRVHAAILRIACRTAGRAEAVVKRVLDLHERAGTGEDISDEMWSAARSAAWSAARSARAAESAARAAESSAASAASAAWSAAESSAASAWSAAYQEIRDAVLAALPAPASA